MSLKGDTAEGKKDTETRRHGDAERITDPSSSASFTESPCPRVPASPLLRVAASLLLLIVVIIPDLRRHLSNFHVVVASFQQNGNWSVSNYVRGTLAGTLFSNPSWRVSGVSVLTVLLCAAVGIPLAFLFERYSFPCRQYLRYLLPCRWSYRLWSAQSLLFFSAASQEFWLAGPVSTSSRTLAVVTAWLAGLAALSHLHDVPVLLRFNGSGFDRGSMRRWPRPPAVWGPVACASSRESFCRNSRHH